ncbi:MAG: hypothetical protein HWE26_16940 [Alteromonadaceae bacterium]|nr:hypothetical protein [Alteromonadaceae bacterium]
MRRIISSLLALSCVTAPPVLAADNEDKWWFDVEVILFARDTSVNDIAELFENQSQLSAPDTHWDLLSDYYQPDITMVYNSLPVCNAPTSPLWAKKPTLDEILSQYTLPDEPVSQDTPADINHAADTRYNESANSLANNEDIFSDTDNAVPTVTDNEDPLITSTELTSQLAPVLHEEPRVTTPPSPANIAGYWLSYVLNNEQLTPFTVPARRLDCVTSRQPVLVTNLATTDDWHWHQADLHIPARQQTPLTIEGINWKRSAGPHLLPSSRLRQDKLFTSIRWRKGLQRLAHFSWRQQVKFGQDNAETLRLFAGQNYASQFNQNGEQREQETNPVAATATTDEQNSATTAPSDTFFNDLNKRLANPQPISFASMMTPPEPDIINNVTGSKKKPAPIWQLDGFIQVYLKYLNNVPYLHINSELFYRQPLLSGTTPASDGFSGTTPQYELVSIPFKQLRRVISTQLHYFDHPLFGMVVQIRRYDRPPAPQPVDSQDIE